MRQAKVFYKDEWAGMLTQNNDGNFIFAYTDFWLNNHEKPAISLTFPKLEKVFHAENLFAFFYHLLPEGINKNIICRDLKIDKDDDFSILIHAAKIDTIGAVTISKID